MDNQEVGFLERARRFVEEDVWRWEPQPSSWTGWAVRPLQLSVLLGEGFLRDQLLLRASALTYVSLLALIPLLAIAFSIVGAIGVSDDLVTVVIAQIAAVSPKAETWLTETVSNVKLGQLGTIGAVSLLATTILAIGNVEQALNQIWGVREQRDYVRRFTDYLAVLVTAPLLLALAMSAMAAFRSQTLVQRMLEYDTLAALYQIGLRWVPTMVMAVAFAFLYRFLPNTHVRIASAVLGGVVAAVLFTGAQAAYVGFQVGSARYNALVGGIAWLPATFVWIYLSWAIVLIGAELAFAHQNLDHYRREILGAPPNASRCSTCWRPCAGATPACASTPRSSAWWPSFRRARPRRAATSAWRSSWSAPRSAADAPGGAPRTQPAERRGRSRRSAADAAGGAPRTQPAERRGRSRLRARGPAWHAVRRAG
jgi:membrane protein